MTPQEFFINSTPINRDIVSELGLILGAVACKVIYAANLKDQVCRMGQTRMADELGISRSTVSRSLDKLVKQGWIEQVRAAIAETSEPAHYKPTDKLLDLLQSATPPVQSATPPRAECNQDKKLNKTSNKKKAPSQKFGIDPLTDAVNGQQKPVNERTAPNPIDQWFGYRDELIRLFHKKTGRYPNEDEKTAIVEYAAGGEVTPERWERALSECNLHYTGQKVPVPRIIEVCEAGSYADWKRLNFGNGNSSNQPEPKPRKATDNLGGYYV